MRLNPFNTNNINVRSSGGGVPGGKAGGIGCGTIVIAAIGYFVFGLDPMQTAGMVEGVQQGQQQAGPANTDEQEVCTSSEYALEACNGLQSLNQTWAATFDAQGYDDLDYLRVMSAAQQEELLDAIGMKPGHRAKFQAILSGELQLA